LIALREIGEQQTVAEVESSNEAKNASDPSRAPRLGVRLMIVILIGLALVAIYANLQKVRRDKIEQVSVTPVSTVATPATAAKGAGQMEDTQPMPIPTATTAPK
jgi:hypothetical protein